MPINNLAVVYDSLTNISHICKLIFTARKVEFTDTHLKLLDTINKLAAIDNLVLSYQSPRCLAVMLEAIAKEAVPSIEDRVKSIYQKMKEQLERENQELKATSLGGGFDGRHLYQRVKETRHGQLPRLFLEDHDVTNLMPKSCGNIEVLNTFNERDTPSQVEAKKAFKTACGNKDIKHIMFPMGPGHWRGIYITKPDGEQTGYLIEIYDSYGDEHGRGAYESIIKFLEPDKNDKLSFIIVPENKKQTDGYTCGDFVCAYSNKKMQEWNASKDVYRQNLIDVLATPYFENESSLLRMVSIIESENNPQSTNAPVVQKSELMNNFEKQTKAILDLKTPDINVLLAVEDSDEIKIQAMAIQQILPKEAVVNSEIPEDTNTNTNTNTNPLISNNDIPKPEDNSFPKVTATTEPGNQSGPEDPLSSTPVSVELASPPKQFLIINESLRGHMKAYDDLVLKFKAFAAVIENSDQPEIASYQTFITRIGKRFGSAGDIFFNSDFEDPQKISASFKAFSDSCDSICKEAEDSFKHDKSAWSKIKPILGGFIGLVVAIAATLLTLGIATGYVASKASRRDKFMDTFFRAEPKALTEAKNQLSDYDLRKKLFGGEQDGEKGILKEIENKTSNSPNPKK